MDFKYLVVELPGLPHPTYPHCICVPNEWISSEVSTKESQRVAIPLPNEEFTSTLNYIQTGGPPKPYWGFYLADTVLAARDFETARFAAESMLNSGSEKTSEKNKKKKQQRRRTNSKINKSSSGKNEKKKPKQVKKPTQKPVSKQNSPKLSTSFKRKNKKHSRTMFLKKLRENLKFLHDKCTKMRDLITALASVSEAARTKMSKAIPLFKERIASIDNGKDNNDESKSEPSVVYNYPKNTDKTRKWTLRHEEFKKGPGLVELLPNSGIYVRKNELEECINGFENSSQFAISLICEVFSDKAITECEKVPIEEVLDLYALKVVNLYCTPTSFVLKTNNLSVI